MASRRTGQPVERSITKYSMKGKTEEVAYKDAVGIMTIQGQNIYQFYKIINEVMIPWLNSHGIIGTGRIYYRQLANEYVKLLNTDQAGEAIEKYKKMLKYKYLKYGLNEDLIDDLMAYLDQLKKTSTNFITLYQLTKPVTTPATS